MKRSAIVAMVVGIMLLFAGLAGAEEKAFTGSLDIGWYNQYVGNLTGGTAFKKPVFQQSVTLNHRSGAYFSIWDSLSPKGGPNSDSGDEVDVSLGFVKKLGQFKVDVGYAYYDLQNLRNTRGDLHGIYLTVDGPVSYGITPFVTVEGDIPFNRDILEGGFLYRAGGKGSVNVAKQAVNLNLSVAGHDGAYGSRPELVSSGRITVSTTILVGKLLALTPKISYQHRLGYAKENGGMIEKEDKVWGGVNLSYPF